MKIATYNVNGVNGRLEVLLHWLDEAKPDVVVLQELKAPNAKFPAKAIQAAGYGAVPHGQKSWNGVAILARGQEPHLTRKGLPGEPEDQQSRFIEAIVDGVVIGGLYLPKASLSWPEVRLQAPLVSASARLCRRVAGARGARGPGR